MKINIDKLKNLAAKLSLAIEKSKLNPKSGWLELETVNNNLVFNIKE